ncbi:hypothetical protein HanRHA438_Chr13g0604791 [Helianthus annuus]|uniref:Uncharacterized protein n=1 Tax=Helianthus annuus TaxID=4232 RepID=A0A251SU40_HELAN|nr:hypothetical protein HanXRQr2_Chr13g0594081 [Helianthus annuus]KAJ0477335.1 hypothetical protein HanHA300_Chr13g0487311 [Helianthus annuus]KAJ0481765.1 hypothetical protein HanIR_Chr13g0646341 [Helianthus annuus]KAJ0498172.1 hypothetical protein HanHA89_Chr13g0519501 [Helianthus annuus]KAJ0664175.1 hypothetical protein HanLR1_Chr13g0489361 [Helianthus annuus]
MFDFVGFPGCRSGERPVYPKGVSNLILEQTDLERFTQTIVFNRESIADDRRTVGGVFQTCRRPERAFHQSPVVLLRRKPVMFLGGRAQVGGSDSFKNYSNDGNEALNAFHRYSGNSVGHGDKFSTYARNTNVQDQSFNTYGTKATGGTGDFTAYAQDVNVPTMRFTSYSDDINGRVQTFKSYSENANASDHGWVKGDGGGGGGGDGLKVEMVAWWILIFKERGKKRSLLYWFFISFNCSRVI